MATTAEWVNGARPRTLFMALAPVAAGTGVAAAASSAEAGPALLALVVALALQVGVNYANDYSDGVRGTDADRVGPQRLVGSGAAPPRAVLAAALLSFLVAGVAGLALAALSSWWLVAVGVVAIAAAWAYTGTSKPYGYRALGEVAVFVFFGLVAVVGTAFVQVDRITALAVAVAVPVGMLACALLVANNVRDIPGDSVVGKRTLAVRLGQRHARLLYAVLVVVPFAWAVFVALGLSSFWPLLALLALPLLPVALRPVVTGKRGPELIPTLQHTGQLTLAYAVLLGLGVGLTAL
ncbi:1,4-dihydroxy-2-naphthoate polyprenyltransferase [Jatrophihabitans sp. YIM 134969]